MTLLYQRTFILTSEKCVETTGITSCIVLSTISNPFLAAHLDQNTPYLKEFEAIVENIGISYFKNIEKMQVVYTPLSNIEYLEELKDHIRNKFNWIDLIERYINDRKFSLIVCNDGEIKTFDPYDLTRRYSRDYLSRTVRWADIASERNLLRRLDNDEIIKV